MKASSITTTVKLPAKNHVGVQLTSYKDPNVLSLTDTYNIQDHDSKLLATRKIFLHKLETDPATAVIAMQALPFIPKLWRAPIPPPTAECSLKERDMLASMVLTVQRWCMDQAQTRREQHETWIRSALEYSTKLQELRESEHLLVTFISKEMKLPKPLAAYAAAATEYAQWLLQPQSPDAVQRSQKYAKAAAMHSARESHARALKAGLESSASFACPSPGMPDVKLSIHAKQCARWVQDTAQKWVADLFEHEDSLHMKRLNVDAALPSRSV